MLSRASHKSAPRGDSPVFYRLGSGQGLPDTHFVALVPGAAAPLVPLDLPATLKGAARERVALRQIGDAYGAAAMDAVFRPAIFGETPAVWGAMLVTSQAERDAWLSDLAPARDLCRAVLPDYLALPASRDCWTIEAGVDGQVRVRLGPADGFTAEPALALTMLRASLAQTPPKAVLRLGAPAPEIDAFLSQAQLETRADPAAIAELGLPHPVILGHGEPGLDLARDPGAEAQEMRSAVRPYGMAAMLAVLALVAWASSVALETRDLKAQALAYRLNAERIARDTMIPTGPILDIRAQVATRVDQRRAEASNGEDEARPFDVLRAAGDILAASDARVTRAAYQANSGLVLDLRVADFAALDALIGTMRNEGITLTVAQSAARENAGVVATLALATSGRAGR